MTAFSSTVIQLAQGSKQPVSVDLTTREREVLCLICEGLTTKEIADSLRISFKTAVSHRTHIMEKSGLHRIALLVRWAIRNGVADL